MTFDQAAWARERRRTDPDFRARQNAAVRRYRQKNKEKTSAQQRAYREQNRDRFAEYERQYRRRHPARRILKASQQSARSRGLEHSISVDDLLPLPTHCPVFGIELCYDNERIQPNSPSLDRIDNDKGYVPSNIMIVSWRANALKKDGTPEEFRRLADFYGGLHRGVS